MVFTGKNAVHRVPLSVAGFFFFFLKKNRLVVGKKKEGRLSRIFAGIF